MCVHRMGNTQQRGSETPENFQDAEGSVMTCEICIEPICLPNKKFNNQDKCAHPYCVDCVVKYIQVKIDDRVCLIKCPALNCEHFLDPLSCRLFIGHHLFDKCCDLLCESAVLGLDRCYCPNRDCSVLIVNECGGSVKQSKCPKCKKLFCFSCKIAWHAGYQCEESRELRDRNDVAFGVLAERKKWKRCPVCHHFVELISGCSIVKCRCGTDFCYSCGKKVNRHWCRCQRYYSRNVFCVFVLILVLLFLIGMFCFSATNTTTSHW